MKHCIVLLIIMVSVSCAAPTPNQHTSPAHPIKPCVYADVVTAQGIVYADLSKGIAKAQFYDRHFRACTPEIYADKGA
ncbi:hypothetical protein [Motilimonas pumila]|uniref:Uncharacterized protein n=1 Tax=Motilimonas pumila TaxID=2303987 RepID=A0A418YA27_9GAMM|nr:hypothetical protein [Motilimonas pumila]RJG38979.1 hypothetical protein D1Z90_18575 [Motilimonas pumila]